MKWSDSSAICRQEMMMGRATKTTYSDNFSAVCNCWECTLSIIVFPSSSMDLVTTMHIRTIPLLLIYVTYRTWIKSFFSHTNTFLQRSKHPVVYKTIWQKCFIEAPLCMDILKIGYFMKMDVRCIQLIYIFPSYITINVKIHKFKCYK